MNRPFRVAFDVDGCLIDYNDKPVNFILTTLRMYQKAGAEIIIWSGGGAEYAKRWAERLKLGKVRCAFKGDIDNVDIAYDDEEVKLARLNLRVPFKIIADIKTKGD